MAKILGPKCKLCRREGVKLYLKGERCFSTKCAIVKRNYPPGIHGVKGRSKPSGYGSQLREKQKAKRYYGLLERQFRLYFEMASRKKENTLEALLLLLELRLDTVVFRLGFASSHREARQLVNHGHFIVNGRKVNIPSYRLKIGDEISISEPSKKMPHFQSLMSRLAKYEPPLWISSDVKRLQGKIISQPTHEHIAPVFDVKQIIEFYSR
jgi:small subunit ribosomal protein S4